MEKLVDKYINSEHLFSKKDKILIGTSGGCDSVALTHILNNLNYNISIAHCNFNLRDKDSDDDERFVKHLAIDIKRDYFIKSFNTKEFAEKNKYSIEEAARILRYNWFEEIRKKYSFNVIATAHHLDDKIETFFINLTAGTGIKGIRSIKAINNKIVRPLLFAKRKEIEEWCLTNHIEFRTDKSNFETQYIRNKFRHNIIPKFNEINPSFSDTMSRNFDIYSDFEKIYNIHIENVTKKIVTNINELIYINIDDLINDVAPVTVLFELISPYGYNSSQVNDIIQSLNTLQSGKEFLSENYRLIKDRTHLIIKKKSSLDKKEHQINNTQSSIDSPLPLQIEIQDFTNKFKILKDQNIAYFDADKVCFPLIIRTKKNGDSFYPFGMKGKKLVSDYYTDIKLNQFEKEECLLLLSGDDIIWIIGHRTDDRYKITAKTKKVLIIKK